MVDMKHLNYLSDVAQSDVDVLHYKESTYMGSWKAAGGVSAWFMFRRNMDRLLTMMKKPVMPHGFSLADLDDLIASCPARGEAVKLGKIGYVDNGDRTLDVSILQYLRDCFVAEDIFAQIEADPSGADGTILACLRDMRRYALLVEAEMVARGVAVPEHARATAKDPNLVKPYGVKPQGYAHASTIASVELTPPATPDDGGQHASLVPWLVGAARRGEYSPEIFDIWWRQVAPGRYVLEDEVAAHFILPEELDGLYSRTPDDNHWVIDIAKCPPDLRDQFPSLPRECNLHELERVRECFRFFYKYDDGGSKYVLSRSEWHAESGE